MIERLILAIGIALFAVAAFGVATRWQVARLAHRKATSGLGVALRPHTPAVVYFWSETCAPCKTVQKPELEKLSTALGERVQIVAINALERPDLADAWGVLGLPTTFIVDPSGQPRRVNHGVTRFETLRGQLELVCK